MMMQSIDGSGHKRVNVGINRVVYWTNVYDHSIKRTTGEEEAMEAVYARARRMSYKSRKLPPTPPTPTLQHWAMLSNTQVDLLW